MKSVGVAGRRVMISMSIMTLMLASNVSVDAQEARPASPNRGAPAQPPATSAPPAQPAPAPDTPPAPNSTVPTPEATTARFGAWSLVCSTRPASDPAAGPSKFCELSQTVLNERREMVLQFAIGIPPSGERQGRRLATMRLPVNVRVRAPMTLALEADAGQTEFETQFCVPQFCIATSEINDAFLKAMREKGDAKATFSFSDAGGARVSIPVSFNGFDNAWLAFQKS